MARRKLIAPILDQEWHRAALLPNVRRLSIEYERSVEWCLLEQLEQDLSPEVRFAYLFSGPEPRPRPASARHRQREERCLYHPSKAQAEEVSECNRQQTTRHRFPGNP